MGNLVRGYWDCQYCGSVGIDGLVRECPTCAHPRDNSVKFYMKQGEVSYLTAEEAATKGNGPDWLCAYCDTLNANENEICISCGATREESAKNYFDVQAENAKKKAQIAERDLKLTGKSTGNNDEEFDDNEIGSRQSVLKKFINRIGKKKFFIGLAAIVAFLVLILIIPTTKKCTIESFYWYREIAIEQYADVNESDWYLPDGANLQYTKQEINHYNQVLDHYETRSVQKSREVFDGYDTSYVDNGDGTFSEQSTPRYTTEYYYEDEEVPIYRDVPVYATKYYYDIWKWIEARTIETEGEDKNPYFGEEVLADNEREESRKEAYYIWAVRKNKKSKMYEIPFEIWNNANIGDVVKVKSAIIGKKKLLDKDGNFICDIY